MTCSRAARLCLVVSTLAAVLLLAPGWAQPEDADDRGDIRQVNVGDFWNFTVSGQYDGWVRSEVVGATHDERGGASLRIESRGRLVPSDDDQVYRIDGAKLVRGSDYATLFVNGVAHVDGGGGQREERWDPPLVDAVFPIAEGLMWEATAQRSEREADGSSHQVDVTLVGRFVSHAPLTVEAGSFDTWRVRITRSDGPDRVTDRWYSESACDLVLEERRDAAGNLLLRSELHAFRCEASMKATPHYGDEVTVRYDAAPAPVHPGDRGGEAVGHTVLWSSLGASAAALVGIYVVARWRSR